MRSVKITKCNFSPYFHFCNQCRQLVERDNECPLCGTNSINLPPVWNMFVNLVDLSDIPDNRMSNIDVQIFGCVLDSVMGMTIEDFFYLSEEYGIEQLAANVMKYFTGLEVQVMRTYKRIPQITLPPGNQLNFRVWLGFQPNYDPNFIFLSLVPSYEGQLEYSDEVAEQAVDCDDSLIDAKKMMLNQYMIPLSS